MTADDILTTARKLLEYAAKAKTYNYSYPNSPRVVPIAIHSFEKFQRETGVTVQDIVNWPHYNEFKLLGIECSMNSHHRDYVYNHTNRLSLHDHDIVFFFNNLSTQASKSAIHIYRK